jgi:hypothetical protein
MFTAAEDSAVTLGRGKTTTMRTGDMPQIIVMAHARANSNEPAVMFTERVSCRDFESPHFQNQLVERLSWAVGDAQAVEQNRELVIDQDDAAGWTDQAANDDAAEWIRAAPDDAPTNERDRQPVSDAQPAS